MTRIMTLVACTALLLGASSAAFAEDPAAAAGPSTQGAASALSDSDIRNQLAISGYSVQSMERKGDKVSVIASDKNGTTSKLLVDAQTGQVTQANDDDDGDDDD